MATLRTLLVVAGLTIAFACLAAMAVDDLAAVFRRARRRVGRLVRPESVRGGPFVVPPLFKEIVLAGGSGPAGETFVRALEKIRDRVADPLFDDVVLALTLHWRRGGKLVPALEAVVNDWSETLRLQREAKALRSGVEASVVLLALLPFVFLVTLQLLAPTLLAPFRAPVGEVVF